MKRMLFNATQAEELRVAIVDGQKLIDLDIESASKEQRKSNIYKAVITRIEPSLEACLRRLWRRPPRFPAVQGNLPQSYFKPGVEAGRAKIQEALKEGQELIVQVEKDERGNKGAALTTYISPGRPLSRPDAEQPARRWRLAPHRGRRPRRTARHHGSTRSAGRHEPDCPHRRHRPPG